MSTDKMREEFEEWALANYGSIRKDSVGDYEDQQAKDAWEVWQVSRATIAIKLPRPRSFGRDEDAISAWEARVVVDACTEAGVGIKRD